MKKLYILAAGLLALFTAACNKDESTFGDHPLPPVVVTGLQDSYTVFTHQDFLRIDPQVKDESRYDYFWTAFSATFIQGLAPKPDTIARTRKLDYEVLLNPGPYILVFNVRDKQTGVTEMYDVPMSVSTLNMNGWYVVKELPGKTDMDFFHKDGRIDNWMAFYNGESLEGKPLRGIFSPGFKLSMTSTDIFGAIALASDKDLAVLRVDNGKVVRTFDDMFFTPPEVKKPMNIFQPTNNTAFGIINDGKVYNMIKGTLFGDYPPSGFKVGSVTATGAMDLGFDQNSKSVICFNGNFFAELKDNGKDLKNMSGDLIWMTGLAGIRSVALALFREPSDSGLLVKINTGYGFLIGSGELVMDKKKISPAHGLMTATVRAGNYDSDYMYYALGNKVYLTDIASLQETLQLTLPAGETVTCIQHVKFPQQTVSSVVVTTDKLAVASYANGRYKVWLHTISSTGTIIPAAAPSFEGEGKVANLIYMEQGNGSRLF